MAECNFVGMVQGILDDTLLSSDCNVHIARSSTHRPRGKPLKPRHSRRSQSKVKKRSQPRWVDDDIQEIEEHIQVEVPVEIVENVAVTDVSQNDLYGPAAVQDTSVNLLDSGSQEKHTTGAEALCLTPKQPVSEPQVNAVPETQSECQTDADSYSHEAPTEQLEQESTDNSDLFDRYGGNE